MLVVALYAEPQGLRSHQLSFKPPWSRVFAPTDQRVRCKPIAEPSFSRCSQCIAISRADTPKWMAADALKQDTQVRRKVEPDAFPRK